MDAPDASSPTMGHLIFLRRRRTGKNPSSILPTCIIDSVADRIPYCGNALPLVDYVRAVTSEGERRIGADYLKVRTSIHVDNALRLSKGRPRFFTPLGARHLDRTKQLEVTVDLPIHNTRPIVRGLQRTAYFYALSVHCPSPRFS